MTEPRRKLDHLAADVLARPIPAQHGAHCEGMAKIVDPGSTAVPKKELRLSQPDLLAHLREVARTAIAKTMPLAGRKERFRPAPEQPVARDRSSPVAARRSGLGAATVPCQACPAGHEARRIQHQDR